MEINGLLLTESTAEDCWQSRCPWIESGFCRLAGVIVAHMNNANIFRVPYANWLKEYHDEFFNFSKTCVISSRNQKQLQTGELPPIVILNASDSAQYKNNSGFILNTQNQVLESTPFDSTQKVVISKA